MLALTGAALSGFVELQNKQKLFHPQQLQNCKMALRDKMQTSVDIFLAATGTSSHQESAIIKLEGLGREVATTDTATETKPKHTVQTSS